MIYFRAWLHKTNVDHDYFVSFAVKLITSCIVTITLGFFFMKLHISYENNILNCVMYLIFSS